MTQPSVKKIAIIYDDTNQRSKNGYYTTGFYCRAALNKLGFEVDHYSPGDLDNIEHKYDLYFSVDDNSRYLVPRCLKPSAYWVIDTHMDYDWRLRNARMFDFVFAAHKDGADRLKNDGIKGALWLPLACDPDINKKLGAIKEYDLSFIGNIHHSKKRADYLAFLKNRLRDKRIFIGQATSEETAVIYAKSKLVFNLSVKDDINMRVFETLSCGRPLVTNDLRDNGQLELFGDKPPFIVYRSKRELLKKIKYYINNESEREEIAKAGWQEAINKHTYVHRMAEAMRYIEKRKEHMKYEDYPEDLSVMDDIYGKAFDLIEEGRNVLDIGCATGRFSKYLVSKKNCFVTGIEKDPQLAAKAKGVLQEVILGDALEESTYREIKHKYDLILLMDVSEHTLKPGYILAKIKDYLKENGRVILITPNIAYWGERKKILFGKFNYEPKHVHLFTYNSIKDLIEEYGYTIRHLDLLYNLPVVNSTHRFFSRVMKNKWLKKSIENIARKYPNLFAYQLLFVIGKSAKNG